MGEAQRQSAVTTIELHLMNSPLSNIVRYSDDYLRIAEIEDYPNAMNGLQIENSGAVTKIGAAVDTSTATLEAAAEQQINFLLAHH